MFIYEITPKKIFCFFIESVLLQGLPLILLDFWLGFLNPFVHALRCKR
ncbi:hypothetical protein ADIS_2619 [Lunatimonas lonarensis]|uniref:Uncharacterized protein n=1 Tax=Lunatimonas lonarensis TaxID=1232681 RepID=R7ZSD1_9BACT|nr:hypothetical protein ADIS_2619 [Lunatimonas lonarensis]